MAVTHVTIHPAIGVARLGDSHSPPYIGPETDPFAPPNRDQVKDPSCRIVKQAARFRVYAWNGPTLVGEVTDAQARITWTVHLANRKAAAGRATGRRNSTVADESWLVIDPGSRTLAGPRRRVAFDNGRFKAGANHSEDVDLGEAWTDDAGRLLVAGGHGLSRSPLGRPIVSYLDNDGWYDDTSDGPITATVTIDGKSYASTAWVVVAPPRFAPAIQTPVTLWDRLFDFFARDTSREWGVSPAARPSYRRDIHPILERTWRLRWVNLRAAMHWSFSRPYELNADTAAANAARQRIFAKLVSPTGGAGNMPLIPDSAGDRALTRTQYVYMRQWAERDFIDDWAPAPAPTPEVTPHGLDRAALDACVGAPFYPGIEVTKTILDPRWYLGAFRLDPGRVRPGDVTARMSVPWQADFYSCGNGPEDEEAPAASRVPWWPAARPNEVIRSGGAQYRRWVHPLVTSQMGMVENWSQLNFVLAEADGFYEQPTCPKVYIRVERAYRLEFRRKGPIPKEIRVPIALEILSEGPLELEALPPRDRRLKWDGGGRVRVGPTGGAHERVELTLVVEPGERGEPIDERLVVREGGHGRTWTLHTVEETEEQAAQRSKLARRPLPAATGGRQLLRDRTLTVDDEEIVTFAVTDRDRSVLVVVNADDVEVEIITPIGIPEDPALVRRTGADGAHLLEIALPVEVAPDRFTGPGTWQVWLRRRGEGKRRTLARVSVFADSDLALTPEATLRAGDGAFAGPSRIWREGKGRLRAVGTTAEGHYFERELVLSDE